MFFVALQPSPKKNHRRLVRTVTAGVIKKISSFYEGVRVQLSVLSINY